MQRVYCTIKDVYSVIGGKFIHAIRLKRPARQRGDTVERTLVRVRAAEGEGEVSLGVRESCSCHACLFSYHDSAARHCPSIMSSPQFPDVQQLVAIARQKYESLWCRAPVAGAYGPGRVNLIGDHTDYNDGLVFPMVIS